MHPRHRTRACGSDGARTAVAGLALAALLPLTACGRERGAARVPERAVRPPRDHLSPRRDAVSARDRRPDLRLERRDRGRVAMDGPAALRRRGRAAPVPDGGAALAPVGRRLGRDQAAQRDARRGGGGRRRRSRGGGRLVRERPHPHFDGPGGGLDLLSRGSAPVPHRRAGPVAHPLALRVDRLRDRAARSSSRTCRSAGTATPSPATAASSASTSTTATTRAATPSCPSPSRW